MQICHPSLRNVPIVTIPAYPEDEAENEDILALSDKENVILC